MIHKAFEAIIKADIDALIENSVAEGKTLDYKLTLPGNSDSDKKEFLFDVSSFANASGGDIIFGINERRDEGGHSTGLPQAVPGLEGVNADAEIRRLENILRDGIAPRIPGVHLKAIEGFAQGPIIILRIPKSWSAPHMVIFQNSSRFYSRNSAGKYQLDVSEIRSAFALSESLPEKIKRFRDDRIAKIIAGETPVPLNADAKIVLHLLPVESFSAPISIMLSPTASLRPIKDNGGSWRYNIDGLVSYSRTGRDSPNDAYLSVYRNGIIEAVECKLLTMHEGRKHIPSVAYERLLIDAVRRLLNNQRGFGLGAPVIVILTFIGAKDYRMGVGSSLSFDAPADAIDRDVLFLPDVLMEDFEIDTDRLLRPVFDAVWQAAGWERSMNYDDNGNWVGQR